MARRRRELDQRAMPMLPAQVPEVIRDLARWAVLTSIGAAAAGGARPSSSSGQAVPQSPQSSGSRDKPATRAREWQTICEPEFPRLFERVKLRSKPDYVAYYLVDKGDEFTQSSRAWLWQELGSACATATNKGACQAKLATASLSTPHCASVHRCRPFLVTTAGDDVAHVEERAKLIKLIGAIDDRWNAVLLAALDGHSDGLTCAQHSAKPLRGTETLQTPGGFDVRMEWEDCGTGLYRQLLHVSTSGKIKAEHREQIGASDCVFGRRPEGLYALRNNPARAALGAFLADAARLEAASVPAFERLAHELGALDAPEALIREAQRSALDEIRHAHAMTALARRFGGEPGTFAVRDLPLRSAAVIARENAVEGCVRESYGALVAHHQAATARDPEIALTMRGIAADETRHAGLSWQIAAWLEPRLPAAERRALAAARVGALAQLFREVDCGLSRADMLAIGWPSPEVATQLIARLGSALAIA